MNSFDNQYVKGDRWLRQTGNDDDYDDNFNDDFKKDPIPQATHKFEVGDSIVIKIGGQVYV